jgi:hypothetical protein
MGFGGAFRSRGFVRFAPAADAKGCIKGFSEQGERSGSNASGSVGHLLLVFALLACFKDLSSAE